MIPSIPGHRHGDRGKPRASGDDPELIYEIVWEGSVNPARAGMILATSRAQKGILW